MLALILTAAGAIGRALNPVSPRRACSSICSVETIAASAGIWSGGLAASLLVATWTALGVAMWVLFPMLSSVFLPSCSIAPLACYFVARWRVPWYPPSPTTLVLLLATGFLLINASWSLSPDLAGRAVMLMIMMVGTLHVCLNTLPDLDETPLRAMAAGALAGLAAGGAFLCLEVFSDQSLRRLLMHLVPALQPNPNHMALEGGQLALAPYLPNANIAVLTLMLWPAALLVGRLGLPRAWRWAAAAAGAVAAATVLSSEHASSQVALLGSTAVFVLFRLWPKLAMRLVIAGWIAANLAVVPATWLLFTAGAQHAEWLPASARHRVVIWRYTVQQIPNAPLLGAGIGTGRAVHEAGHEGGLAPGTPFELSTSLHSHNAYLQVWYEAGAVGAAIVLALGLAALWGLRAVAADTQPYLAAVFVACALLVASAYSIWAPWFLAALAMAAIFAGLGAALPARGGEAARAGAL